jgi:NAD(P)H dehydrogenase (quinone)
MYAITGITGKVGGALARSLLADRRPVRAVVRDIEKGRFWASQGCEIARAEMQDPASLTAAFTGTDGVFILPPSEFDPAPGFPEARAVIAAVKAALESAGPNKVVCLSTIGAQSTKSNLLTQRTLMEQAFGELPMPITFLRPGWFMENAEWDVASARDKGMIASFLQPLDKPVPMVATADIGQVASKLFSRTGPANVSLSWRGRNALVPKRSELSSQKFLDTPFALKRFRVKPGRHFSNHRECFIQCHAYRCWTDSMRAGSTSRAVRLALSKERLNCRPSSRSWWIEPDENDFPKSSSIKLQETDHYESHP